MTLLLVATATATSTAALAQPAPTAAAAPDSYSIFAATSKPASPADSESRPVELGVSFRSDAEGWISAIKYYRLSVEPASTKGTLWGPGGAVLGQASFPAATAVGWQTAKLATPVKIAANTSYVASYNAPGGRYPADQQTLGPNRKIVTYGLTAQAGVYSYAAGVMPTKTWADSNYYADIVFSGKNPSTAATTTPRTTTTAAPTTTARPTTSTPSMTPPVITTSRPSTSTPRPTTSTTTSPTTPVTGFPTRTTVGVPANWTPTKSVTGNYTVSTAGAVVQDLRITNGSLIVNAPNVTVRRVEILGGSINNFAGSACQNGLVIEDTTVGRSPNQPTSGDSPAIGVGGYTARRVKIDGLPEGFRVGGKGYCGPVTIENSFASVSSPDICTDWHGDGLQGYDGPALTIKNSYLDMIMRSNCGGTAPFFYPYGQGNTSVNIDGLIVKGGGYSFRLGMPGSVRNLHFVNSSWIFGPLDVKCSALTAWDAKISTLNSAGQPVVVRSQACNTETGN